ncbi:LOG family protein [Ignavigranum ruoffiae]
MNIAVYCGSKIGLNPKFSQAAKDLGSWLAQNKHTLIYGGASHGLMGLVADACLQAGGNVIGVATYEIHNMEHWHQGLNQLITVDTLSQRKGVMSEQADAYIALPGGPGTLEEIVEMISWARVQLHHKPCLILNIDHYYDALQKLLTSMVEQEFILASDLQLVHLVNTIADLDEYI